MLSERDLENLSWAKKFLNDYERKHKMDKNNYNIDTDLHHYICKTCGHEFYGMPGLTICPNCAADNLDEYKLDS